MSQRQAYKRISSRPTREGSNNITLTFGVEVRGQVRVQHNGVAKRTFLRDTFQLKGQWVEAGPQRLHEEQVLLFRELEKCLQLGRVRRGRLLA